MGADTGRDIDPDEIHDEMKVLEPYTTGELASYFDASKQRIRNLLEKLSQRGKIRKKVPEPNQIIWIKDAPVHDCPNCGYEYEVKFIHPIFSTVQFCPQCGTQL